jgi:predicted CXXCH cytochrome family protein
MGLWRRGQGNGRGLWRRTAPGLAGLYLAGLVSLGAAPLHPYRTRESVTQVLARGPHAGDCEQCHTAHGETTLPEFYALVGPDDNSLCDRCHSTPWAGGSYGGTWLYAGSSHGSSSSMIWPGPDPPPRTEAGAAGKCLNCHDPHGWTDASGDIPEMTLAREEKLCLACHDGSPATSNIGVDLAKPYTHPVTLYTGRHKGPTEQLPSDFAAAPINNRHAECEDCHNPHVAHADTHGPPLDDDLSGSETGVSRVRVANGGPGAPPTFFFTPGSDSLSAPVAEYQVCFKCHSSWTVEPTGQTDLALVLNPANPSYHPVEAAGRDRSIHAGSFVAPWGTASITRCGDCHGSDFAGASAGPHGSAYRYILKRPYTASSTSRLTTADETCFACHSYDVYASSLSSPAVRSESRFNDPATTEGHAKHVADHSVPCYACHVTHGSTTQPHLIATGRTPGILSYTETPTGGTCTSTCHGPESYTLNYAR